MQDFHFGQKITVSENFRSAKIFGQRKFCMVNNFFYPYFVFLGLYKAKCRFWGHFLQVNILWLLRSSLFSFGLNTKFALNHCHHPPRPGHYDQFKVMMTLFLPKMNPIYNTSPSGLTLEYSKLNTIGLSVVVVALVTWLKQSLR